MTNGPIQPTPPEGGWFPSPPQGNPFERRAETGFFPGLARTFAGFLTSPGRAYAQTRRRGDWASPLIFGIIVITLATVLSQAVMLALGPAAGPFAHDPAAMKELGIPAGPAAMLLVMLVMGPLIAVISLFLNAGLIHLFLWLLGGTASSQAGFEGTFRTVAYASVAQFANLIPFVGMLIALIWTILLEVTGLVELHGTTHGRAVAAVLLPLVVLCGCGAALVFLVLGLGGMAAFMAGA